MPKRLAIHLLVLAAWAGQGSTSHGFDGWPATGRARVVIVEDAEAVETFQLRPERIGPMVERGLIELTGQPTPGAAWRRWISTQDIVGIKVYSAPGPTIGTRPAVVSAVVQSLLASGIPPQQLIIWDKQWSALQRAGFVELAQRYGIRAAASLEEGYDESVPYDTPLLGRLVWGDHEFGRKGDGVGRRSFISKLVTRQMTKVINVSPLLNHNLAGVCGNLYSLAIGSADNTLRFETGLDQLATALPEIYALPELGDRVVLNIVDALICQYQGEESMHLHYSSVLGQLRFSTDPVALDVLSIQELGRQRQLANIPSVKPPLVIYSNASLLDIGVSDSGKIEILRAR